MFHNHFIYDNYLKKIGQLTKNRIHIYAIYKNVESCTNSLIMYLQYMHIFSSIADKRHYNKYMYQCYRFGPLMIKELGVF